MVQFFRRGIVRRFFGAVAKFRPLVQTQRTTSGDVLRDLRRTDLSMRL